MKRWWQRSAAALGVIGLLVAVYAALLRPWLRHWGTTPDERTRALPGDDVVSGPAEQLTRAITIDAPVAEVWPWLAQLGQDRGGFYSYEVLEDLAGAEIDNAGAILPGQQTWKPGDKLWMYPPGKLSGAGHAAFVTLVPGRALVFATRHLGTSLEQPYDGSWSFVLEPIDAGTTRLLARGRGARQGLLGTAFDRAIFDPVHFAMERRMMEGIRERAEGRIPSSRAETLQVVLWTVTFGLLIASIVLVHRRRAWLRPLLAMAGSGALFQLLTLAQPSPTLGGVLVVGVAALLWWPQRERRIV